MDTALTLAVLITYNLFAHTLASVTYKDLQYEAKNQSTITMLLIIGIIGMVVAKFISNKIISNGIFYGSILLILTAIMANWQNIASDARLFLMTGLFGFILWYAYTNYNTES